jgi:hypothetical protein
MGHTSAVNPDLNPSALRYFYTGVKLVHKPVEQSIVSWLQPVTSIFAFRGYNCSDSSGHDVRAPVAIGIFYF